MYNRNRFLTLKMLDEMHNVSKNLRFRLYHSNIIMYYMMSVEFGLHVAPREWIISSSYRVHVLTDFTSHRDAYKFTNLVKN